MIKEVDGVTTVFHYDFNGNIIAESYLDGNFNTEYLYNGKGRVALVNVSTGEMFFFLNDRLGTPQMLTDASNTVVWEGLYKPFGEADVNPNSSVVNNFRFPGQYYDQETGLHYNWHRYYDPDTGRYLTPDPVGLAGGINLFLYADGNSVNLIDPLGLSPACELGCILLGTAKTFITVHIISGVDATIGWLLSKVRMPAIANLSSTAAVAGLSGMSQYWGAEKLAHSISDPIVDCVKKCRAEDRASCSLL